MESKYSARAHTKREAYILSIVG